MGDKTKQELKQKMFELECEEIGSGFEIIKGGGWQSFLKNEDALSGEGKRENRRKEMPKSNHDRKRLRYKCNSFLFANGGMQWENAVYLSNTVPCLIHL